MYAYQIKNILWIWSLLIVYFISVSYGICLYWLHCSAFCITQLIFTKSSHKKPVAYPLGQDMGCLLWLHLPFIFCFSQCRYFNNIMLYWTTLYRHSTVFANWEHLYKHESWKIQYPKLFSYIYIYIIKDIICISKDQVWMQVIYRPNIGNSYI